MTNTKQATQQVAQTAVDAQLEKALAVINGEHTFINSMRNAEIEKKQLGDLARGIRKPYADAAAVVSKELRTQLKSVSDQIAAAEKPTYDKLAVDTVEVGGQSMTKAARLALIAQQRKEATGRFNLAKQALYDMAAPAVAK